MRCIDGSTAPFMSVTNAGAGMMSQPATMPNAVRTSATGSLPPRAPSGKADSVAPKTMKKAGASATLVLRQAADRGGDPGALPQDRLLGDSAIAPGNRAQSGDVGAAAGF